MKRRTTFLLALTLAGCALAGKPVARMEWRSVCAEHGNNVRAKKRLSAGRAKQISDRALSHGLTYDDEQAVIDRTPRLGMGPCAAIAALGQPETIDAAVSASGTRQQWGYSKPRMYLYFNNERLIGYQH